MQALVLAGGLGTRLRSVLDDRPKSLAPISGRPFLLYLLNHLKKNGIHDIILAVGYMAERVEETFGDGSGLNMRIRYSREESPLGTGGALRYALPLITDENILVLNGDTYFDTQYDTLLKWHRVWKAGATIALRNRYNDSRYGLVQLGDDYRVMGYAEKPAQDGMAGYINSGVYLIRRELIGAISQKCSLEYQVFPEWIRQGVTYGLPFSGKFIDIGVPDDYCAACDKLAQWINTSKHKALFLDRDGVIHEDLGHLFRPGDVRFITRTVEWIKKANRRGLKVVVVTNQAGVAKGYYSETDVQSLHYWMGQELKKRGAVIDAFYYCPHHPEGIVGRYKIECDCRKPQPGLILRAADERGLWLEKSWMVGDQETDRVRLPYLKTIVVK